MYMTRILFAILVAALHCGTLLAQTDSLEYVRISRALDKAGCSTLGDYVVAAAEQLMGRPYVGGTLDNGANEVLTVSLQRFDCVIFQETCLALAKDAVSGRPGYGNFRRMVESLRYRDGKLNGYQSRLHYSTDWILDNTRRGNAEDVTPRLGGVRMTGQINYMSTHSDKYKALSGNRALTDSIAARERFLSAHHVCYIPKDRVAQVADKIENGSLIFMTSQNKALGYGHVGIAVRDNGVLRMIHASSVAKKIVRTPGSLSEYLLGVPKITGITVLVPR